VVEDKGDARLVEVESDVVINQRRDEIAVSDSVNRGTSTVRGSRKPVQLDCL